MSSPVCTESGFIGQSQRCCSLASCAQCSGTDLLRTEMRIAEGVRSEWLGCCKRFVRAELNIRKARHGEGQFWVKNGSVRARAARRFTLRSRYRQSAPACPLGAIDRDRGEPRGSSPPTPPYVRV